MPNNNFYVRSIMEGFGRFIGHMTLHSMAAGVVNASPVLVEFLKNVAPESIPVDDEDVMEPTLAMQIGEVVRLFVYPAKNFVQKLHSLASERGYKRKVTSNQTRDENHIGNPWL